MSSTRRDLVRHGAALITTGALAVSGCLVPTRARAQGTAALPMPDVKALVFDVFGTVVDWRSGVAREAQRILKPMGYELDWPAFADAWRAQYGPSMEEIRSGQRPFVKLDILHRENLERILPRFKIEKLDEPTLAELNLAWHKLDAWPDVGPAFARLHKRFLMAPCSNGNIALMADVARRNNLPWDAIRDRPGLQAAAESLPGDLRGVQPQARAGDDVRRAQRRLVVGAKAWTAHWPCRTAGRGRCGHWGDGTEGLVRCRG